jgi:ribonuclease G
LHTVSYDCPTCNGLGRIATPDTVLTRLENWLKRFRNNANDRRLSVMLNKEVLDYINETKSRAVKGFMWDNWMLIDLQEDQTLSPAEFRIFSKKRKIDVTDEV